MNFRKIILVPLPPFFLITNCRLLFSSFQEGMMTKLSMKLPWHKILRIHIFRKSGTVRKGSKTLFYRLHLFNSCSLSCMYTAPKCYHSWQQLQSHSHGPWSEWLQRTTKCRVSSSSCLSLICPPALLHRYNDFLSFYKSEQVFS